MFVGFRFIDHLQSLLHHSPNWVWFGVLKNSDFKELGSDGCRKGRNGGEVILGEENRQWFGSSQ